MSLGLPRYCLLCDSSHIGDCKGSSNFYKVCFDAQVSKNAALNLELERLRKENEELKEINEACHTDAEYDALVMENNSFREQNRVMRNFITDLTKFKADLPQDEAAFLAVRVLANRALSQLPSNQAERSGS